MKLNQKLAGLTLAMSSAFALIFPPIATAADNEAHGAATFEEASRPANHADNKNVEHMDNNHIPKDNGGVGNETPPPIPEPETYAMMLAGLGALGMVVHRRRDRK